MDYELGFASAIERFWAIKERQQESSDARGTSSDSTSGSVRAAKHMSGFEDLIRAVIRDAGVPTEPDTPSVYLPGYYRETKQWDVVVSHKGALVAVVEAKSQGSSLANNFNNRVEEAIGQAADVWKAFEKGLIVSSVRPWVGYLMIVEDTPKTTAQKHLLRGKFVPDGMLPDTEFDGRSYAERYSMAFGRLDRERLLDGTCIAITRPDATYTYPDPALDFRSFATKLRARCEAVRIEVEAE